MKSKINILILIISILLIISNTSLAKSVIKYQYDNKDNFTIDELYTNFEFGKHKLTVGKKHLAITPGKINQLIVNKEGPSFPLIYLEDDNKYFDVQQAVLFVSEETERKLFIRRLSFDKLIKNFEIGFTEAIIASEFINPLYYLPYPYVPAYLYKKLSGLNNIYDKHDDTYAGIDISYKIKNMELYGELMVDEYPSQPGATNPDKRGHLAGLKLPILNNYFIILEYSNVFAAVYEHRYEENDYTYLEENIGHTFGADLVEYDLQLGYKINNNIYSLTYSKIKKGPNEGEDGILLNEVINQYDKLCFAYTIIKKRNEKYKMKFEYINEYFNNDIDLNVELSITFLF